MTKNDEKNILMERNPAISIIRALATISIVCCHILQYMDNYLAYWFNVGVYLFLAISGFLYGQKQIDSIKSYIIKQFKKILIPYCIFAYISLIAYYAFDKGFSCIFLLCPWKRYGLNHLWFVPYILICYLINILLNYLKSKYYMLSKKVFYMLIIILICVNVVIAYYLSTLLPTVVDCFVVAYCLGLRAKERGTNHDYFALIVSFIFAVPLNATRIMYDYAILDSSLSLRMYALVKGLSHLTLGIFLFLLLFDLLSRFYNNYNSLLRWFDCYSYFIYLVHHIFILGAFSFMNITPFIGFNIVMIIAAIVISAYFLEKISSKCERFFSKEEI